MKITKGNIPPAISTNVTTKDVPLFSNHGSLSTALLSKYPGSSRFVTNKSIQLNKSKSPVGLKSPKETTRTPLYKRNSKAQIMKTKTPTLDSEKELPKRNSFVKEDNSLLQKRTRESIRLSQNEGRSTSQSKIKVDSPHKSTSTPHQLSTSKERKQLAAKSQSNVNARSNYNMKTLPTDNESEERPRNLSSYKIQW